MKNIKNLTGVGYSGARGLKSHRDPSDDLQLITIGSIYILGLRQQWRERKVTSAPVKTQHPIKVRKCDSPLFS